MPDAGRRKLAPQMALRGLNTLYIYVWVLTLSAFAVERELRALPAPALSQHFLPAKDAYSLDGGVYRAALKVVGC